MATIMEKFRLNGKKAIVTGGLRGIGKAIAVGLNEAGADVAIVDRDTVDQAKKLLEEIKDMGRNSIYLIADVSKKEDVQNMVDQVMGKWGRIDILVNNVGICINAPAEDMTEEEWDKVIDVNLKSVFLCSQAVGRVMIEQKSGSIINIGSMSGYIVNYPQPQVSYNAAKAGVHMMTKCLATEWAPHNIRVNAIAPGYTQTGLLDSFLEKYPEEAQKYWIDPAVQERIGLPEEQVGAAVYLASDASTYTTGEVITIDGGYTLR